MTGTPVFTNSAGDPPTAAEIEALARAIGGGASSGRNFPVADDYAPPGERMIPPPGWSDRYDHFGDDQGELYGLGYVCRACSCTDARACPGGCDWAEPNLCTACAPAERRAGRLVTFGAGVLVGGGLGFWLAIGVFAVLVWIKSHG